MKKVLTMSMVAAVAVVGNAFAAQRDTRMSDIVRLLEDNPHLMAEVEADIATRAALKVPTTKVVSLKKTTPSTNGLYNTISGPSLGDSNGETIDGTIDTGMVQFDYTLDEIRSKLRGDPVDQADFWCDKDRVEKIIYSLIAMVHAGEITTADATNISKRIRYYTKNGCTDYISPIITWKY